MHNEPKIFAEMLNNNEPCALSFRSDDSKLGYDVLYRVKWSTQKPNHLELYDIHDGNLVAVLDKNDSDNIHYFNINRLRKPEFKTVYVVTRSDGVRKEFPSALEALMSGAVDPCVLSKYDICADYALASILDEMEKDGSADTVFLETLRNLSEYITSSNDNVFEFWERRNEKDGVHHYCVIETYSDYRRALEYMADVYGWKVEEEERYGF